MKKIVHESEAQLLEDLPDEVRSKAAEIAAVLDEYYGESRDAERDLGGYVLIAEEPEDMEEIRKVVDFAYTLPEFVDKLSCLGHDSYTNTLMLLSSDYSISLLIPLRFTPVELLRHIDIENERRKEA